MNLKNFNINKETKMYTMGNFGLKFAWILAIATMTLHKTCKLWMAIISYSYFTICLRETWHLF